MFMSIALAAAVFSEFISNAKIGVKTVETTSYSDYPYKYTEISALLNTAEKAENGSFYRAEVTIFIGSKRRGNNAFKTLWTLCLGSRKQILLQALDSCFQLNVRHKISYQ